MKSLGAAIITASGVVNVTFAGNGLFGMLVVAIGLTLFVMEDRVLTLLGLDALQPAPPHKVVADSAK